MSFVKGMRVQFTALGKQRYGKSHYKSTNLAQTGVVVSHNPKRRTVRVIRDGSTAKGPTAYWDRYWEPIPDEPR